MTLAHSDLTTVFNITPGCVNVLVVEPEDMFFCYAGQLVSQAENGVGEFCLAEGDKILNFAKQAVVISDYFGLRQNDKKFLTKLYQRLADTAEAEMPHEADEVKSCIFGFLDKLNARSDCALQYDCDAPLLSVFKAFGVTLARDNSLLDDILAYMKAALILLNVRCFFFIGLKTVLTSSQIELFYREAELLQINVFLVENVMKEKLQRECVLVIDRALCEIIV